MLEKVKLLLGITDNSKDDLLTFLIEQAIVVYNYNRLGTEGLDSEGYSGVSLNYSADYPEPIIRALKAKRKLITL